MIKLDILKDIQARIADVQTVQHLMDAKQDVAARNQAIMQQDLRMVRAAINDVAKTNVTSGEVEPYAICDR